MISNNNNNNRNNSSVEDWDILGYSVLDISDDNNEREVKDNLDSTEEQSSLFEFKHTNLILSDDTTIGDGDRPTINNNNNNNQRCCRILLSIVLLCLIVLLIIIIVFMMDNIRNTNTSMILFNKLKDKVWRISVEKDDYRLSHIQDIVARNCHRYNRNHQAYTLDFGTLLGAMRMGNAIPWDHDCDISLIYYPDSVHHHTTNHNNDTLITGNDNLYVPHHSHKPLVYHYDETLVMDNDKKKKDVIRFCDTFERDFNDNDIINNRTCIYDFDGDSFMFNYVSNNLNRKIPCKLLTETMRLGTLFPDSPWSHCSISIYATQMLDFYYGKQWNSDWQSDYKKLGIDVD